MPRIPTRAEALASAAAWFDAGSLLDDLRRRVAIRTESQVPERGDALERYLTDEIGPSVERLGFRWTLWENAIANAPPMLFAERIESAAPPTVLTYGHGDVIPGYDDQWREGRSPWEVSVANGRWYGRGTADNKGQHSINLAALGRVLEARGRLGFNVKLLLEMGEEIGSPGLRAACERHANELSADVLIASDGPRLRSDRPTLFLGSRGAFNFELDLSLREGAHHSGNWGGLLANPGTILANAISSLLDAHGRILIDALRPAPIPPSVRRALSDIEPGEPGGPAIDRDWGEPDLTPAERVFGWNALEVLAFRTGNPDRPANAIPARASALLQLRFVAGCDPRTFLPAIRSHLDARGLKMVAVRKSGMETMAATRLDPDHPWVRWASASIAATTGSPPAILPNLGGSLPNDCFAEVLSLPTIWVPHSYPACSQHAPDEHMLATVAREGLQIMTGLFWDLGEGAGGRPTAANTPNPAAGATSARPRPR
ncbi:MAG TPA: M20 family metallopeptidase [Casimicrobiaceae bacterium]|nr:M20 family metallopeptidase [Casimicrobiaceae bacterium]